MIQELLGGNSAPTSFLGERKISIPFSSPPSTTCPSTTPILTTTTTSIATTTASAATLANASNSASSGGGGNGGNNNSTEVNASQQNLRCPRCDSTNTKFCYYNNYNLTQPRHFCKTCRRYWTKGGTLRNVPIGGGCRKNKSTTVSGSNSSSGFAKSSTNAMAKAKATLSTELLVNGNHGYLGNGLLDHLHHHSELQSSCPNNNPILWPSLPQNSHILSLLRGSNQFHNPNPNPNPLSSVYSCVKTEGSNSNTTTTLGLDSYGNGASSLLGSYPRSNNQHQVNGFSSGVQDYVQQNGNSSNILELYQRLKSSSNYSSYCGNENSGTVILGNMVGSTSPSSPMHTTILDSAPVGGADNYGGYSFMTSPGMSGWSEYPIVPINGAYP